VSAATASFTLAATEVRTVEDGVITQEQAVGDDGYALGAPLVAFEIVSPSESAVDIEAKSEAYVKAGARAVVWIYPRTRTARIAGEQEQHLREPDTLELPDILPGWSLPLADLFLR